MAEKQLYNILGVNETATTVEITSAFRKLAKIFHPDKPTGNEEKFKEISHAYEILSDAEKRKIYDLQGINGLKMAEQSKSYKEHAQSNPAFSGKTFKIPPNNNMFNDLFGLFFNANKGTSTSTATSTSTSTSTSAATSTSASASASAPTSTTSRQDLNETNDNPPIKHKVIINLKDVYLGCIKTIKYHRNLICQNCYGKGYKPHCHPVVCHSCNSTGKININKYPEAILGKISIDCTYCQGQGYIYDDRDFCETCKGLGIIKTENTVDINIKPGMNDKIKLKYENLGNEEPGKTAGDLLIELLVDNPTNFEVDGVNLKLNVKVTLIEALSGFQKDITFVDDNIIRITTDNDQIIQQGETKIYKGSGLPIYDDTSERHRFGDLFVQFQVVMPNKLSTTAKEQIVKILGSYPSIHHK
jgi:DnaJ-class molecular chaperone